MLKWFREYISLHGIKELQEWVLSTQRPLNDFEQYGLVPEIKSRLIALANDFDEMKRVCENKKTAINLERAISSVIRPEFLTGTTYSAQASSFLHSVSSQIDTDFIAPINQVLSASGKVDNIRSLLKFANEANRIFCIVIQTKNKLFVYKMTNFVLVIKKETDEFQHLLPPEYFVTLLPFRARLDEMETSARASEASLKAWQDQAGKTKEAFLKNLTIQGTIRNNTLSLMMQMASIVFAIAVSSMFFVAADPFSLNKKNSELRIQLDAARERFAAVEDSLIDKSKNLERSLTVCEGRITEFERLKEKSDNLKPDK